MKEDCPHIDFLLNSKLNDDVLMLVCLDTCLVLSQDEYHHLAQIIRNKLDADIELKECFFFSLRKGLKYLATERADLNLTKIWLIKLFFLKGLLSEMDLSISIKAA